MFTKVINEVERLVEVCKDIIKTNEFIAEKNAIPCVVEQYKELSNHYIALLVLERTLSEYSILQYDINLNGLDYLKEINLYAERMYSYFMTLEKDSEEDTKYGSRLLNIITPYNGLKNLSKEKDLKIEHYMKALDIEIYEMNLEIVDKEKNEYEFVSYNTVIKCFSLLRDCYKEQIQIIQKRLNDISESFDLNYVC